MEKLVLVTGSGRGLGATIAQTFADQNFQVAINYSKSKNQAETLAHSLGKSVEAFEADIKENRRFLFVWLKSRGSFCLCTFKSVKSMVQRWFVSWGQNVSFKNEKLISRSLGVVSIVSDCFEWFWFRCRPFRHHFRSFFNTKNQFISSLLCFTRVSLF